MGLRRFPKLKFVSDREAFFMEICRDKVVLHLGCADAIHLKKHAEIGRHLHILINSVARRVYGVDINQYAIKQLRSQYGLSNLYVADVETLNIDFNEDFDIIIAGELLEHLNNPGLFLDSIKSYMSNQTLLICTTPNLLSLKCFLHNVVGNQAIHPDHSIGFTFSLIETLFARHNYYIAEWLTSVQRFSSWRNWLANQVFCGLFSIFPGYAETMIVVAKYRNKTKEFINEE
jgi:hypothetical protein